MKTKWLLSICVLLFTCLVAYRAVVIPVTHDEASTWLNYRHYNLWSCLTEYWCWHTANNHWLNTLLMQWSGDFFGEKAWALRLPNVLAGGLYFMAAALISIRYVHSPFLRLSGFLLLCAHVYLLDFFSLFRGYGLMASGILWGIYCFLRYSEQYDFRWLFFSVLAMVLAVFSNFTALLPFVSIGVVWFILLVSSRRYALLIRHGVVWVVCVILFAWLLSYPIRMLNGSGEFEWGSDGLLAMLADLMSNLLYGIQYFGLLTPVYLLYGAVALFVVLGVLAVLIKQGQTKNQWWLSVALLLANIGLVVVHQLVTGSQAPVGRKSIYLIPFLFTPLVLGLNLITRKTFVVLFGVVICGVLLYHTFRPHSWASCREWYYDAYYPELFSAILPAGSSGDSIRLGSSWIFNPSLSFYQKTQSLPISGLVYQKPLVIDSSMQYYFVESPDTMGMYTHGFLAEKNIGPFFLFRKASFTGSPAGK